MVLAIGEETAEQEIREIIKGGKKKEYSEAVQRVTSVICCQQG